MKRYPAYDPPEYQDWRADPAVMEEFRARLSADAARAAILSALPAERHLALYAGLLRNRLHDIALKRWVKQGVLSKAWLGTGEEAATIGAVHALRPGDHVGPMIRNAGACHELGMPVADMLRAYLGTYDTITRGRDLHTGDLDRGIVPPISMVSALVPVLTGMALAFRMKREDRIAVTWVGDGSTRAWEFHEGVVLAASQRLPVLFILQNNQVALGTSLEEGVAGDLKDLHETYGIQSLSCDGNNVLDVFAATSLAADLCRRGEGPAFIVAETFRMGGHATHDESEARQLFPAERFAYWGKRDPIGMYETWLIESGPALSGASGAAPGNGASQTGGEPGSAGMRGDATGEENRRVLSDVEAGIIAEVDAAAEAALHSRDTAQPPPESAIEGVYAVRDES